jgi:hypothetical protein
MVVRACRLLVTGGRPAFTYNYNACGKRVLSGIWLRKVTFHE